MFFRLSGACGEFDSNILPTACEAVKKLDFVFLALVFSVSYRREKPDFSIFSQLLAQWATVFRPLLYVFADGKVEIGNSS
ncbi:MAG: hypothetical protein ABSE93_10740 [Terriglobia bacterium]|jgi:hypothetical protein